MYRTVHLFEVYDIMVFGIVTEVIPEQMILEHFHRPRVPHPTNPGNP